MNVTVKDFDIETWYKRLGYIGEKRLETLASISLKTRVHCLIRKAQRVAFKNFSSSRKSQILDLIHTDICMIQSRSIGGALYFVTFIYACCRKV